MIRLVFHLLKRFGAVRRAQVGRVALLTVALLAFSTTGFLYFELEHKPDLLWGDAFWWSVVTMTTVGYGDLFPSTPAGRYLIGFPTMLFGIGVLGYLFSTVASFLLEARSRELRGMAELFVQQHILVIHYPSEARLLGLLDELRADPSTKSLPVVLIDEQLEELPPSLSDRGLRFVRGAATKESVLAKAMVADAKHAILLARHPTDPSSDDSTLAAVLTLEHVNPAVRTVAECVDPERVPLMRRAGCDAVVCLAEMSSSVLVS
ncbi:MAG: potassium channel family protein, partial [Myxococcota bacterium]